MLRRPIDQHMGMVFSIFLRHDCEAVAVQHDSPAGNRVLLHITRLPAHILDAFTSILKVFLVALPRDSLHARFPIPRVMISQKVSKSLSKTVLSAKCPTCRSRAVMRALSMAKAKRTGLA